MPQECEILEPDIDDVLPDVADGDGYRIAARPDEDE